MLVLLCVLVAWFSGSSCEGMLEKAQKERDHDQEHELREVDRSQDGEQLGADPRCLRGCLVPLRRSRRDLMVLQSVVEPAPETPALDQGADHQVDLRQPGALGDAFQGLLQGEAESVASHGSLDLCAKYRERCALAGQQMEGPLQRDPGSVKGAHDADQIRKLAPDPALAPAPLALEDPDRDDVC